MQLIAITEAQSYIDVPSKLESIQKDVSSSSQRSLGLPKRRAIGK